MRCGGYAEDGKPWPLQSEVWGGRAEGRYKM